MFFDKVLEDPGLNKDRVESVKCILFSLLI